MLNHSSPVASFIREVDRRLARHPLKTNGRLASRRLASLVKEATGGYIVCDWRIHFKYLDKT